MYGSWEMVHDGWMDGQTVRQMDGQTDGKSDIQRWVPHLKKSLKQICLDLKREPTNTAENLIVLDLSSYTQCLSHCLTSSWHQSR